MPHPGEATGVREGVSPSWHIPCRGTWGESPGVKEGVKPHLPKNPARKTFSGAYAPEKLLWKKVNKILKQDCVFGVCVSTPLGRYRRASAPRELGAIAQAPFSGAYAEPFSGKPFQEASPPEKPSGKNSQGVKEGVKPHLPKNPREK